MWRCCAGGGADGDGPRLGIAKGNNFGPPLDLRCPFDAGRLLAGRVLAKHSTLAAACWTHIIEQ